MDDFNTYSVTSKSLDISSITMKDY